MYIVHGMVTKYTLSFRLLFPREQLYNKLEVIKKKHSSSPIFISFTVFEHFMKVIWNIVYKEAYGFSVGFLDISNT
jgi:hypothetical protein